MSFGGGFGGGGGVVVVFFCEAGGILVCFVVSVFCFLLFFLTLQ